MIKPYGLLEGVLNEIEKGLKEGVNDSVLADKFSLSPRHLMRLFKFAFGQILGTYIRSRKLAASINDILLTDNNILDIALEYELDYEQSYIMKYSLDRSILFHKFDLSDKNGNYLQWEWFAPVVEKTSSNIASTGLSNPFL